MKKLYLILMTGILLSVTACGKKDIAEEQSVSGMEKSDMDEQEQFTEDIAVDENAVIDALDAFSTGVFMEDNHKHDDGGRCRIWFTYAPDYTALEFSYSKYIADTGTQKYGLDIWKQDERIGVLVSATDKSNVFLETKGTIDTVKLNNLKRIAETLMNYESFENAGVETVNGNVYWVENVKCKDSETVQFLVCADKNLHSMMVKYDDLYLGVTAFDDRNKKALALDGSHECEQDKINSEVKAGISEDLLNEWEQWLNN